MFATTPVLALESGNTIIKTESYMFVTRSHEHGKMVSVFVSNYKNGFTLFKEA